MTWPHDDEVDEDDDDRSDDEADLEKPNEMHVNADWHLDDDDATT